MPGSGKRGIGSYGLMDTEVSVLQDVEVPEMTWLHNSVNVLNTTELHPLKCKFYSMLF